MNAFKQNIKVIAFDADDTLWDNEPFFQAAEQVAASLLAEYGTPEEISKSLFDIEMKNMDDYGYGAVAFTMSLIENAIQMSRGKISGTDIGKIIENEFFKSFEIRKELYLGRFVIMPNHLHAIIILDNTNDGSYNIETYGKIGKTHGRDVETHGRASLPQFIRRPKSISSFVAGFKSSSVNCINEWMDLKGLYSGKFNRTNPLWQANYHDHIIRNKKEYQNIALYIENNPTNWEKDSLK